MTITKVGQSNGFVTYTVTVNGAIIGLLVKSAVCRTPQPWKAYKGIGEAATFVGAFFDHEGGKSAALSAIGV